MHTNVLLTCTNALLTHTMTRSTHVTLLHYLLNTSHLLNYLVSFSSSCACGVGGRARAVWFEEDIPKWGECWHTNIHPILGNKVVCGNSRRHYIATTPESAQQLFDKPMFFFANHGRAETVTHAWHVDPPLCTQQMVILTLLFLQLRQIHLDLDLCPCAPSVTQRELLRNGSNDVEVQA